MHVRVPLLAVRQHAEWVVLVLAPKGAATAGGRQIEPQTAFVWCFDLAADQLGFDLGTLRFVHAKERLQVQLDAKPWDDLQTIIKQRFHVFDVCLQGVLIVELVHAVDAEA